MGFSIVQHVAAQQSSATSAVLAFSSNVTAGNMLVAWALDDTLGGSQGVSDNLNGAWQGQTNDLLGTFNAGIFARVNTLGGACTVTYSVVGGSLATMVLMMAEVSGVETAVGFADQIGTSQGTGGANPSTVATFLSASGEFVFGAMYLSNSSGRSGVGFAQIDNLGGEFVTQWRTGGNTGSELCGFVNTVPATGSWMVQVACFKSVSGGNIGTHPGLLTLGVGR